MFPGHEITHGFDDKGRLFDCDGNLHRWWSDSAIEAFHRRAQCLIDQYGQYVVPEVNMKLDGVNTQVKLLVLFIQRLSGLSVKGVTDETDWQSYFLISDIKTDQSHLRNYRKYLIL